MPAAVITGASRGLGRALARALAARGWHLVLDARSVPALSAVAAELEERGAASVAAIAGDVSEEPHQRALTRAVADLGHLDLLVNNASLLGPSPQPQLADYPISVLERVYAVNVLAPLALTQDLLPWLAPRGPATDSADASVRPGVVVNVSSDAAAESYDGWGGYGSSKAALDSLSAVLAVEQPSLRILAFDPGDMRTAMHQEAFPGEDISDRPEPETVVPLLLALIDGSSPSGRYRAADLRVEAAA